MMSHEWSQGSLQASISTSRGRVVPEGSCAEIEQKGSNRSKYVLYEHTSGVI